MCKEERDVLEEETREIDECDMEEFDTLLRGTVVNRTCGLHKKLPGMYLTISTNNIWSY